MENGVLAVAAIIALSLLWNTMATLQRNFVLQQQVDITQQEVELLELETANLEFQQKYYESEEFLELSARERLGKIAPGEKVMMLPPVAEEQEVTTKPKRQQRSNFEQWVYFFFGQRQA